MKRNRSQLGFAHLAIIVIISLVVLGAASFAFYKVYTNNQPEDSKNIDGEETTNQPKTDDASNDASDEQEPASVETDDTTDVDLEDFDADFTNSKTVINSIYNLVKKYAKGSISMSYKLGNASTTTYQPSTYNYSVRAEGGSEVRIVYGGTPFSNIEADTQPIIDDVTSLLNSNGFALQNGATLFSYQSIFIKDNMVCLLGNNTASPFSISCNEIDNYASAYEAYSPFVQALKDGGRDIGSSANFANLIINDGIDGFKNASMSGLNAAQIFYKTPTNSWTYLTSAQSYLSCNLFSDESLTKAFYGQECIDSNQSMSTVK